MIQFTYLLAQFQLYHMLVGIHLFPTEASVNMMVAINFSRLTKLCSVTNYNFLSNTNYIFPSLQKPLLFNRIREYTIMLLSIVANELN